MKLVFFGTSQFGLPALEALNESKHSIVAIFTQADKRGGRHLQLIQSPVKKWALKRDFALYQPRSVLDAENILKKLDADLFLVVAYGNILAEKIINLPKFFSINIHPSLLPEYRGAAPVNWAIIEGKSETGVTIFKLTKLMDAGDIILKEKVKIAKEDTNLTLDKKLSELGAKMLIHVLDMTEKKKVQFIPQDESCVTYAPKLKKEDGFIDWTKDAQSVYNLIRGTLGWPGAFTYHNKKRLKIHEAEVVESNIFKKDSNPGEIICLDKDDGIIVKAGKDYLNILTLQLEGKSTMPAEKFLLGYNLQEGDRLE